MWIFQLTQDVQESTVRWPRCEPCSINLSLKSSGAVSSLLFLAFQNDCFWVKVQLNFVEITLKFYCILSLRGLGVRSVNRLCAPAVQWEGLLKFRVFLIHLELLFQHRKQLGSTAVFVSWHCTVGKQRCPYCLWVLGFEERMKYL